GAASKEGEARRAGHVVILGADERLWSSFDVPVPLASHFWQMATPEDVNSGVVLNATLARDLSVKLGDRISLHLQKATEIPRETLLGRRGAGEVVDTLTAPVLFILPDDYPGAQISLNPSPEAPRNAFVPLKFLQERLDLKGRVNALLVGHPRGDLQADL